MKGFGEVDCQGVGGSALSLGFVEEAARDEDVICDGASQVKGCLVL